MISRLPLIHQKRESYLLTLCKLTTSNKKTSPNVPKSNPNGNHMAPKWQFPITNQNDILIMSKTITYKSIADT